MKRSSIAILAGILLAGSTPTFAQSLLGGVISGSDGNGLVTLGTGNAGSNGLVNVGLGTDGSSNGVDVRVGGGSDPVASVNVGADGNGGSGSILDVDVGSNNRSGLLGVDVGGQGGSGNAIGLNVLTSSNGGPAAPGRPRNPGQPNNPAIPGQAGAPGLVGSSGDAGFTGTGGASKVNFLARLLENRAWLRFASGNAICLPPAGIANIGTMVRRSEANRVNQLLGSYSGDIGNLRSLLAKCGNRNLSAADIERAITVDLRNDGTVVLYVL